MSAAPSSPPTPAALGGANAAKELLREARDLMRQGRPTEDDFPVLDERVEAPPASVPTQKVVVPPQPKNAASWVLRTAGSGVGSAGLSIAQNPVARQETVPNQDAAVRLSPEDESRLIEAVLNRLDLYGEQKLAEHIERSLQPLVKKLADVLTRQVAMDATGLVRQQIAKAIGRELEKRGAER